MASVNLTNHFLIAMPALQDSNFSGTLTYICRHDDNGAMGLVVNRPTSLTLENLFNQIDIPLSQEDLGALPVYFGGPVQTDRGFVLHSPVGHWRSTLSVNDEIGLTTSRDILEEVSRGQPPQGMLISLGYAGWEAGQLENEIKLNSWLTVEARQDVIFNLPAEARFSAALGILGIDRTYLSDEAGHA
ncbi:MAG: YqgE/AlgH family protein [Betaproteobacteria bacterium]|nr:YqgE/AlgH family protein [Betaproteobacteria bacterium]